MSRKLLRMYGVITSQGMLRALTLLGLLLPLGPIAVFVLAVSTGFRLTERWDIPLFVVAWAFLLGTPAIAGAAALIARKRHRKGLYRVNLGVLTLWLLALLASLFLYF